MGCVRNIDSYNIAIEVYCEAEQWPTANILFSLATELGPRFDIFWEVLFVLISPAFLSALWYYFVKEYESYYLKMTGQCISDAVVAAQ